MELDFSKSVKDGKLNPEFLKMLIQKYEYLAIAKSKGGYQIFIKGVKQ